MREGSSISRRSFIKLAATAGAAAAIPGCEPAARKLIPYVVPDENVVPGVPSFFATTCNECPAGCGVVARIREGRVVKLEGNPADPIGQGSLCARGQAALQGLYNPDRLRHPQVRASDGTLRTVSWDEAEKMLADKLAAAAKAGKDRVAFFGAPNGPTFQKIALACVGAHNSSRAIFYEAINNEPARVAAKTLFGRRDLPAYRIDQAEVLISFGADFLETWQSPVELARQYSLFRTPQKRRGALTIGRATYVGPRLSMTASKCDEWIATAPGAQADVAWSVLNVLVRNGMVSKSSGFDLAALGKAVENFDPAATSARTGVPVETITRLAETFGKAGSALALAGTDDSSAHLAAMILNAVTGNFSKTIMFFEGAPAEDTSTPDEVDAAIDAMRGGEIDVAFVAAANPVFTMPPSSRIAEALQKVPFVVWAGGVPDETAAMANLLLPAHHPLESWRDTAPRAGVRGLGQPVMQPVFDSKPLGDILLATAAKSSSTKLPWTTTAEAVKTEWLALAPKADDPASEDFWTSVRREGGLFEEQHLAALNLDTSPFKAPVPAAAQMELSVYAYPHIFLYDGRGADKPWLQELPEPVTQLVWDSWAEIHPETARKLGVATGRHHRDQNGARGDRSAGAGREHRASRRDRRATRPGTSRVRPLCERRRRQCVVDTGGRRDLLGRNCARDRCDPQARIATRQKRHDGPFDRRGDEYRAARERRDPNERGGRSHRAVRDVPEVEVRRSQMGHDHRRQRVHRMQRVRDGVLRGKQRADGRQGRGR